MNYTRGRNTELWKARSRKYVVILQQINAEYGGLPSSTEYKKICKGRGWPSYGTMARHLGGRAEWPKYVEQDGPGQGGLETVGQDKPKAVDDVKVAKLDAVKPTAVGMQTEKRQAEPGWMKFLSPNLTLEEALWKQIELLEKQKLEHQ